LEQISEKFSLAGWLVVLSRIAWISCYPEPWGNDPSNGNGNPDMT